MSVSMTYREAHPSFVANYMSRESAERHAAKIGGRCVYVWCNGIDTWSVFKA